MSDHLDTPNSAIKGSGFFNVDDDFIRNDGKILFAHPDCVLTSQKNLPFMAFVTTELVFDALPSEILLKLLEVTNIVLQATFSGEEGEYIPNKIPKWVNNFGKAKRLVIRNICIDNLKDFEKIQIQHLVIQNIIINDINQLVTSLTRFKSLLSISCDAAIYYYLKHHIKNIIINVETDSEK